MLLYVGELVGRAAKEIGKVSKDVKFFPPITLQLQQLTCELATTPQRAQSAIFIKKANFQKFESQKLQNIRLFKTLFQMCNLNTHLECTQAVSKTVHMSVKNGNE